MRLDKANLKLKKETEVDLGQISYNDIADKVRRESYHKIIDILWSKL